MERFWGDRSEKVIVARENFRAKRYFTPKLGACVDAVFGTRQREIIKGRKCQFEERRWCMARRIGYDLLLIRSPGGQRKDQIGHILNSVGLEGGIFIYQR